MSLAAILSKSKDIRAGKHTCTGLPVVVPMAGFYRRSDDAERLRNQMYFQMATIFGFTSWRTATYDPAPLPEPGRDGQARAMEHYGDRAKATFRDNLSHPMEYLEGNRSLLNDPHKIRPTEQEFNAATNASVRRVRLARDYHETWADGIASGLKSVDLERISSTGFGPGSVSDHKISCMQKMATWERNMPRAVKATMQITLQDGVFTFLPTGTHKSDLALRQICVGLDIIAEIEGELTLKDLHERWPDLKLWQPRSRTPEQGWADR